MADYLKIAAQLTVERDNLNQAIAIMHTLAAGAEKRRGRPPAWMSALKRRGRPPGSKNKSKDLVQ